MTASIIPDSVFEFLVEIGIVQEDVGVIPPPIEMSLDRFDGLDDAF